MSFHVKIHANSGLSSEIELSGATTICSLRPRFYSMTGFAQNSMKISVDGNPVTDESLTLSELASGNCVDIYINGKSEFGDLSDASNVQKFEISDADYDSRKGTVREFKRQHGIPLKGDVVHDDKKPEGFEIGHRCEVEMTDHTHNRGTIRFVGKVNGTKGYWIGVELDEPVGKNDGSVKGSRYFKCDNNYGIFVRENKVKVGDYPPIDWEAELADEI